MFELDNPDFHFLSVLYLVENSYRHKSAKPGVQLEKLLKPGLGGYVAGFLGRELFFVRVSGRGVWPAVRGSWKLIPKNAGSVILNGFVMLVSGGLLSFLLMFPLLMMFFSTPGKIPDLRENPQTMAAGLLMGIYLIVVNVGFGGLLSSFGSVRWTQGFSALDSLALAQGLPVPRSRALRQKNWNRMDCFRELIRREARQSVLNWGGSCSDPDYQAGR